MKLKCKPRNSYINKINRMAIELKNNVLSLSFVCSICTEEHTFDIDYRFLSDYEQPREIEGSNKNRSETLDKLCEMLKEYEYNEITQVTDCDLSIMKDYPEIARLFAKIRIDSKPIYSLSSVVLWLHDKDILYTTFAGGYINIYIKYYAYKNNDIMHRQTCNIDPYNMQIYNETEKEIHAALKESSWDWYISFKSEGNKSFSANYKVIAEIIKDPLISKRISCALNIDARKR